MDSDSQAMNFFRKGGEERVTSACRVGIYETASRVFTASIVPGFSDYSPGISVFSKPWNAECLENWRRHAVQIVEQAIFLSRNLLARRRWSRGEVVAFVRTIVRTFEKAREQMLLLMRPQRLVEEAFSFRVYYSITVVPPRRRLFFCVRGLTSAKGGRRTRLFRTRRNCDLS